MVKPCERKPRGTVQLVKQPENAHHSAILCHSAQAFETSHHDSRPRACPQPARRPEQDQVDGGRLAAANPPWLGRRAGRRVG